MKTKTLRQLKPLFPITGKELVAFRTLLLGKPSKTTTPQRGDEGKFASGSVGSDTALRAQLAEAVGVDPVTIWRVETGGKITHGIMLRRALNNIADEMGIKVPTALRYGHATKARATSGKTKAKAKAAGAK